LKITYHRDATITFWDVYTQGWVRTSNPSNEQLATLGNQVVDRIRKHVEPNCETSWAKQMLRKKSGPQPDQVPLKRRFGVLTLSSFSAFLGSSSSHFRNAAQKTANFISKSAEAYR
jgi:hypothetical protein